MNSAIDELKSIFESRNELIEHAYYILINLILVTENVRPAFLLQYIDYGETKKEHTFTNSILLLVKKYFPTLIQSKHYHHNQGVIISKISYDGRENIGNIKMGKILGYPCYKDFNDVCSNETESYTAYINAKFRHQKVGIIVNRCKTTDESVEFENFSREAEEVLKKEEYRKIFGSKIRVLFKIEKHILTQDLIDKLCKNKKLRKREKDYVINILYNFDFGEKIMTYFEEGKFQYRNPVHKGILLSLLLNEKNDQLGVFYPIQNHGDGIVEEIKEITKNWEESLLDVLEKTKQ